MGISEEHELEGRPEIRQRPLLIFSYLGLSLFISGFIMTVLAFAPTDSYLMVLIQELGVMAFLGPIVLVIGTIMLMVAIFYCCADCRRDDDDYYDDY